MAYQSSTESSEENTLYFDPFTGKLSTRKTSDKQVFGGVYSSALTDARSRGYSSKEFEDRVKLESSLDSGGASLDRFYKIQSLQMLGKEDDRVVVPIWIARDPYLPRHTMNVAPAWVEHLQQAMKDINYAAPGLFLHTTTNPLKAKIKIAGNNQNSACFTRGNILETTGTDIFLYSEWSEMKRTSCHELLHAIGFQHEHQRRDRESSIHENWQGPPNDDWYDQYKVVADILGITRFDPFSILLYSEDEKLSRNRGDPVWITKPYKSLNREMSELDKVALNNVYRPCEGPNYSPQKFGRSVTGIKYCGRYFGVQDPDHDGNCGPTNGPNCPACRVLKTDRVERLWRKGKWQGWTGMVYCGRYFGIRSKGHDGYCGPNNGPNCPECHYELLHN